jgi:hypothetical protein
MATETKYYTSEEISNKYNSLALKKKIWLYDAIDYMQSYNGKTDLI